jgi:hypothetical protein
MMLRWISLYVAIAFVVLSASTPGVPTTVIGGGPCDASGLHDVSCNGLLPGCPQTIRKCYTAGTPDKHCVVGGSSYIRCNAFQSFPACTGANADKLDTTPCDNSQGL